MKKHPAVICTGGGSIAVRGNARIGGDVELDELSSITFSENSVIEGEIRSIENKSSRIRISGCTCNGKTQKYDVFFD